MTKYYMPLKKMLCYALLAWLNTGCHQAEHMMANWMTQARQAIPAHRAITLTLPDAGVSEHLGRLLFQEGTYTSEIAPSDTNVQLIGTIITITQPYAVFRSSDGEVLIKTLGDMIHHFTVKNIQLDSASLSNDAANQTVNLHINMAQMA
jgi:hypothetical protein